MKPILYEAQEKGFTTNGLGILTDAISCYVDAEINSTYEMEMQYPADGIHFGEIRRNAVILAKPDTRAAPQPFRIYRITKPIGGTVKVFARHIAYDLAGIPISPFKAENAAEAMAGIRENAAVDCPFTFGTDKTASGTMEFDTPRDGWSALGFSKGGILSVYGGELDFDRFTIQLRERLGTDNGVTIRYGKNLRSFQQDENCADVYTGVYPYYKGKDGAIISLDEKVIPAEGNYDHIKIQTVDLTKYFGEAPTQEQLRDKARDYIRDNKIGVPKVSWTIGYVQLSQTEEYKGMQLMDDIQLGDSVTVIFPRMNVNVTSRVVKTKYNVLCDRHESISIGEVKKTLSDTIAEQSSEVSRLGGGLASAEAKIEEIEETVDGIRMDTNDCIADIGDVKAGMSAIASADDIAGLKDANTTLYAQIYDNFDAVYSGLELSASRTEALDDRVGTVETAQAKLTTRVGNAETTLLQKAEKTTVQELDESVKTLYVGQTNLATRVGNAESALLQKVSITEFDDALAAEQEAITELSTQIDGVQSSLTLKANTSTVEAIAGRVNTVETAQANLTTRVGNAESALTQKVSVTEFDEALAAEQEAITELSAQVDGAEARITLNAQNISGVASSVATIQADVVNLKGRVDLTGMLSVNGGAIVSSGPIYAPNQTISGGSVKSQNLYASSGLYVQDVAYSPIQITSTSGPVRVLGVA